MKVIVSVQAKSSSSRGLLHYIAHSKTDPQREPMSREIFNGEADTISVEKANDLLKTNISSRRTPNSELHHLVISLRPETFEQLGGDDETRQNSLKNITREAISNLEKTIVAERLSWAAAIHRNTDHPHVHIAVGKEYFDEGMKKKYLTKIPPSALPHYVKTGEIKIFEAGLLSETAGMKIDEIIKANSEVSKDQTHASQHHEYPGQSEGKETDKNHPSNEINQKHEIFPEIETERDILARALLAKYFLEKSREKLERLENHGDRRRFVIFDQISGRKQRMSLFDLGRRAEQNAAQKVKNLNVKDPVQKELLIKDQVAGELQNNADGIKRIKTVLHKLIVKANQDYQERVKTYQEIKPLAENIRLTYRRDNIQLPIPHLTPEDIEMLQSNRLEKNDIRGAQYLERVRHEIASERQMPTRFPEEVERLKARQYICELKALYLEKQLKEFPDKRKISVIEINGEKWTLGKVNSLIEKRASDDRKISGKIGQVLGKIGLKEDSRNLSNLQNIKQQLEEKLDAKSEALNENLRHETALLNMLNEFYRRDTNPDKESIEPKFTAAQLADIESMAFELKHADVYRENWHQQKELIENFESSGKNAQQLKEDFIAGRSIARHILCEIEYNRTRDEINHFKKNKDFHKFEISNRKSGTTKFVSLAEVQFVSRGSVLDRTLDYIFESRETRATRHEINQRIKEREHELKENLTLAKCLVNETAEETKDYQSRSIWQAANYRETPIFTPKELIMIESRIRQTQNKPEAVKLQKLLDAVDFHQAKNLATRLADFSSKTNLTITSSESVEKVSAIDFKFNQNETRADEKTLSRQNDKILHLTDEKLR